jgi:FAD binding domain/Berberine and berberine like
MPGPCRRSPRIEGDNVTTTQQQATLVSTLRTSIDGQVLVAGDPGYDKARTPVFPVRIGTPLAVVRPKHAGDVVATVDVARRTRCPLIVRGGGHHAAAHSTGDGLLLDLSSLTDLDVDVTGRTAWAQTGLTAEAVARALAPHGLAVGFGDTGTVGIGGITLGGGIGFLSRLHGMTIDNVLAAEIVTADGQVRTIDARHGPDLFWAVRGGGGNFGVVTGFRYRLADVAQVHGGVLILPATPAAIAALADACTGADDALTVIANVMAAPPMPFIPADLHGQVVVMAQVCYAGDPTTAEQALAPLRSVGPPIADLIQPMPYAALFAEQDAPYEGQVVTARNMFVEHIDEPAGEAILEHMQRAGMAHTLVQFRVLGGAISRVPADATAYAHRQAAVMVTIARYVDGDHMAARRWTEGLGQALQQRDRGAYVSFFGPDDADRIDAAYPGETLTRLRRIKAKYDPTNLFCHNDNIRPEGG